MQHLNINHLINAKAEAKTTLDIAYGGFYNWLKMQRDKYMPSATLQEALNSWNIG